MKDHTSEELFDDFVGLTAQCGTADYNQLSYDLNIQMEVGTATIRVRRLWVDTFLCSDIRDATAPAQFRKNPPTEGNLPGAKS
jgi:hypothetical protein